MRTQSSYLPTEDLRGRHVPILVMLCLVLLISLGSLLGIHHLYTDANRRTETVQTLQLIARYGEQLRRYEGQVLSTRPSAAPVLTEENYPVQVELDSLSVSGSFGDTRPLQTSFDTYMAAFAEETKLVASDNIGSAVIVHRTRTVPAGVTFRDTLDSVLEQNLAAERAARERAMTGMVVTILLAAALICGLLVTFDRNRRTTIDLLRKQETRFRSLVEHGTDVTVIIDPNGTVMFVTPAVKTVFGADVEHVTGKVLIDMIKPEDQSPVAELVLDAIAANGAPVRRELRFSRPGDTFKTMDAVAVSRLDDPAIGGVVITARDVSERKVLLESLRHQAHHDSLTSLPNRVLFADRLEQAIHRSTRHSQPVSLLFIDLDGFKSVNDQIGHSGGDDLLMAVAMRLQGALRLEDTVARLGGDEFVVILEQCDEELAVVVANRLLDKLSGIAVADRTFDVHASIGIAVRSTEPITSDEMLSRADIAMYRAKSEPGKAVSIHRLPGVTADDLGMTGD